LTAHLLRRRWKLAIPLVIACGVLVAYQSQAHAAANGGSAPAFSATQVADGVMFDNGPAAAYLTSLNRPYPPPSTQTTAIESAINAAISASPQRAASLQTELQSGDPNQVQNALAQLGSITVPVLDQMFGPQAVSQAATTLVGQINGHDLIDALGVGTQLANYAGDYVYVDNAAVAYNVVFVACAAVTVVIYAFSANGEAANLLALARQLLVANIAANLQETI
jgi:hypothetical protein